MREIALLHQHRRARGRGPRRERSFANAARKLAAQFIEPASPVQTGPSAAY